MFKKPANPQAVNPLQFNEDRLAACWAMESDGAGGVYQRARVNATAPSPFIAKWPGSPPAIPAGVLVASGTFGTDATWGPFLALARTSGQSLTLLDNTEGGDPVQLERGTLIHVCRYNGASTANPLAVGGSGPSTPTLAGEYRLIRLAGANANTLRLSVCVTPGSYVTADVTITDWTALIAIALRFGPTGWRYAVKTSAGEGGTGTIATAVAGLGVAPTGVLAANNAGGTLGDYEHYVVGLYDEELPDVDVTEYQRDCFASLRTLPIAAGEGTSSFATQAAAHCSCVTEASATFSLTTGRATLASSQVVFGVKVYKASDDSLVATKWSAEAAAAETDRKLTVTVAAADGLLADTEYWYVTLWGTAGSGGATWPMPAGTGRFHTDAAGAAGLARTVKLLDIGDLHLGSSLWAAASDGFGLRLLGKTNQVAFNVSRLIRDVYLHQRDADLIVLHGDLVVLLSAMKSAEDYADIHEGAMDELANLRNCLGHLCRVAPIHIVPGNHDGRPGFMQNCNDGADQAAQKQITNALAAYWHNPGPTTYSHQFGGVDSGENEGAVGALGAPVPTTALSWLPDLTAAKYTGYDEDGFTGAVGYLDRYVRKASATPAYQFANTSPLRNFWAQHLGPLLLMGLDPYHCASPGDAEEALVHGGTPPAGGRTSRVNPDLRLGAYQQNWAQRVAIASDRQLRVAVSHGVAGRPLINGLYYGRGWEDASLCGWLEALGFDALLLAHDHNLSHRVLGRLHCLRTSRAGQADNFNSNIYPESYGTNQSEGADVPSRGAGEGPRMGIQRTLNVPAYQILVATPTQISVTWRVASCNHVLDGSSRITAQADMAASRWLGQQFDVSRVTGHDLTLYEIPSDLLFAIKETDAQTVLATPGGWWQADTEGSTAASVDTDEVTYTGTLPVDLDYAIHLTWMDGPTKRARCGIEVLEHDPETRVLLVDPDSGYGDDLPTSATECFLDGYTTAEGSHAAWRTALAACNVRATEVVGYYELAEAHPTATVALANGRVNSEAVRAIAFPMEVYTAVLTPIPMVHPRPMEPWAPFPEFQQ